MDRIAEAGSAMIFKELPANETFYFAHDENRHVCVKLSNLFAKAYRVEWTDLCYDVDDDTISVVEWQPHELGDPPPHASDQR